MKRVLLTLPLLAALGFAMPRVADAETYNVNTEADVNDGNCDDSSCSLREAVLAANAHNPADDGATFNIINVPAGHYVLTGAADEDNAASGDLDILSYDVQIKGAGANLTTIDGDFKDRIFHVPAPLNVTIVGVELIQGSSNNTGAGGILYMGSPGKTLIIDQCEFRENGTAGNGGAIGVASQTGVGKVEISSTTIAGNTAGASSPNCGTVGNAAKFSSFGYNILGDLGGCAALSPDASDNVNGDPELQPLANNGGGTRTHALLSNSPAVNMGNPQGCVGTKNVVLLFDQRGQVRPAGGKCDIGAFELGSSDLQISKKAGADSVQAGNDVTYTIEIRNDGANDDFNVTMTDTLPAGLVFKSVTPAENCSHNNGVVTCLFDKLSAGQNKIISLVVNAVQEGNISNTASVTGSETEQNPADNESSDSVTVTPAPGSVCGNGDIEAGEECDDGNLADGDGCDSLCQLEDNGVSSGGGCSLSASSSPASGLGLLALVATLAVFALQRRSKQS